MKIVEKSSGDEEFLELCLNHAELGLLESYMILSKKFDINGELTDIRIKLELKGVLGNASD